MSSVFDKFRQPTGQPNIVNIMQTYRQVQQDPASIGRLLFNSGRIDEAQLKEIEQMRNPRQIGEYLLRSNPQFQQLFNNNLPR